MVELGFRVGFSKLGEGLTGKGVRFTSHAASKNRQSMPAPNRKRNFRLISLLSTNGIDIASITE
jgi:hypothetical protein